MESDTSRFVRTSDAVLRQIAGEHLLVPIRKMRLMDAETLFILDDVGSFVWGELASARTLDALVDAVEGEYEVPADANLRDDLRALLGDLVEQGLVRGEGSL